MRTTWWYLIGYWQKHGRTLLISLLSAVVVSAVILPFIIDSLTTKPRQFIGVVGRYNWETLPSSIANKISLGLTSLEEDGTVNPGIATRWISENDGTTYRFIIADSLLWHDGKPLIPEDISYQLPEVEVIYTQNDVVFRLPEVFVPFLTRVTQPLLRFTTESRWLLPDKTRVIGLGEYQVIEFSEDENFLTELKVENQQQRLIYRFFQTEQAAIVAFKHGQVDELQGLTNAGELLNWDEVTIDNQLDTSQQLSIFFNTNRPFFGKNIRQGLAYATPKPTDDSRAVGPISSDSWVFLPASRDYAFDLAQAQERLLIQFPNEQLRFTLTTTPQFVDRAEQIKVSWEELGDATVTACYDSDDLTEEQKGNCPDYDITVEVRVSPVPDTNQFDALLIGQSLPPDPDQYALWHSDQPTNITNYSNPRTDALLERGRQVAERDERRTIYQEFQQFLLEDSPVVFIEYLPQYTITRT